MAYKNKENPLELSAQSIEFLGLEKQPFNAEILTKENYFDNQSLRKVAETLTHQAQFSDLLLIIEGPQGSGKTSFFRQFIQSDISNVKMLAIQAEATDTLVQIQQKMSLHLEDLGDANHLPENLKSLQDFDQIPLLIIDSSHVLSDTTLQELLRFQSQLKSEDEVKLKILLFANTGMSETLQKITDISADQLYVQSMPSYSPKQIESFINHKLRHAGYTGQPILDDKNLTQIIKKSSESLSLIMQAAVPIIEKWVTHQLKPGISSGLKTLFAILIIALLASAAAAYYFLFLPSSSQTRQPALDEYPANTEQILQPQPETTLQNEAISNITLPTQKSIQQDVNTLTENNVPSSDIHPLTTESSTTDENTIAIQPVDNPDTQTEPTQQTIKTDATNNTQQTLDEPPALEINTDEVSVPTTTETIIKTEDAQSAKTVVSKISTNAASVTAPVEKSAAILHPALAQLNLMGLKNQQWLEQQPPTHWTLQIIGAREPETLLNFARRHQLAGETAWYKTWLKGKAYYVLVYGSYPNRDSARNSIAQLPASLKTVKPWAKSFKAVQQTLN